MNIERTLDSLPHLLIPSPLPSLPSLLPFSASLPLPGIIELYIQQCILQHIKRQQGQCVICGKYGPSKIQNSSFDLKVEKEHCELAVGCVVNIIALHDMAIAVYLVCLINEHVRTWHYDV